MIIERPQASEFNEYYARYIGKVPAAGDGGGERHQ